MKKVVVVALGVVGALAFGSGTLSALPPTTVVYDAIGADPPPNVASIGFEATSADEFGDRVGLAAGPRNLASVTVLMSSWGCEDGTWHGGNCSTTPGATFDHELTVNVYAVGVGNAPGALLGSLTQTVAIPYRPSADTVNCTGGRWYDADSGICFNGFAVPVVFEFDRTVVLPNDVIWSIAYNTSHHGHAPLGELACFGESGGCGYDSLNVGAQDLGATVGTDSDPDGAYADSSWAGFYCDGGSGGTDSFREDTSPGCWAGFRPLARIETAPATVGPPTNANQCKKDGWKAFNNPPFKNQGDCTSFVSSKGKNPPNG
jgi:hypothetical protein